jgi:hypothetical protein
MGLLERFRTRRAIKLYARRLPRLLQKDYGGSDAYTPTQVQKTIERYKLDARHSVYAIAMFCDRDKLAELQSQFRAGVSFDEARGEISSQCFGGSVGFSARDFLSDSCGADGGLHSGDSGHFDAGGGDSGSN